MNQRLLLSFSAALGLLAACGGGGGGSPGTGPAPAPTATTVTISGRAVDGPLAGATACYDLDDDGACGAAEPASARTGSDGGFSLAVAAADAGRHAVVVEVPADAVDADTGAAVGSAFVMRAPASGSTGAHAVFVSPLTTLVQALVADGSPRAEAEQRVRQLAGLDLSPLADFGSAEAGEAGRTAARVARLVFLVGERQRAELAGLAGQRDLSGHAITAADIDAEVQAQLPALLPAIAATAAEGSIAQSSGALQQALLRAAVPALVAQGGLTVEAMRFAGTQRRLAEPPPADPPAAGATLTSLRMSGTHDYFMRALVSSAADNVADANGFTRYYEQRWQGSPNAIDGHAVTTSWSVANSADRAGDLHWNGSAWVVCALNQRFSSRLRDAQGRSEYDYCGGLEKGTSIRRWASIAGESMLTTWNTRLRNVAGSGNWSLDSSDRLGTATMPAGSWLIYQSNTIVDTAPAYDPRSSNQVMLFNAAVAAGGDARQNPALACNDPAQYDSAARVAAGTLEDLVGRLQGKPCTYAQGGVAPNQSLSPNEWWSNSTVSLGDLTGFNTLPANTGNYYNTTAALQVAFTAGSNATRYYRCYRRASDGSVRNCSLLGLGSWRIETLGDARVMRFNTPPALATRLGNERVFVERGGKVFFGFRSWVGQTTLSTRLNLTAANALTEQLGLPRVQPITQPGTATGARATTLATLKGAWSRVQLDGGLFMRVGDDGRYLMAEAFVYDAQRNAQTGAELGWMDYDPATQRVSALVQVDSNLTVGLSHPGAADGPVVITADQITPSDGAPITRLVDDPNGLVGLWALGSKTDLSVPHLAIFPNGRAMLVTSVSDPQCQAAGQCPPGAEFGSWSFDAATGTLTFSNPQYDTNGCEGVWEFCPAGSNQPLETIVITFAADKQSFSFVGGDAVTYTFHRIGNGAPDATAGWPTAFSDDFSAATLDAAKWTVTNVDARATLPTYAINAGRLEIDVPGGTSGVGGVTSGLLLTSRLGAISGDFEFSLSVSELLRQASGANKDNSGLSIEFGGTRVVIAGNYVGYWYDGTYDVYNKHHLRGTNADGTLCGLNETLGLAQLYSAELRIRRVGGVTKLGHRLGADPAWTEWTCTAPASATPTIMLFSGDGGNTASTGRFVGAIDNVRVKQPAP